MSSRFERGSYAGIWFVASVYRVLGRPVCMALLAPMVFYFYVTGKPARRASLDYLARVHAAGSPVKPTHRAGLTHAMAFAESALDRLAAWVGDFSTRTLDGLEEPTFAAARADSRGAMVFSAHIGCPEVIRAIATLSSRRPTYLLVDKTATAKFNRMIQAMAPESQVKLVDITGLNPGAGAMLSAALDDGAWIIVAADRLEPGMKGVEATLLGAPVFLPSGPWKLASALKARVHVLFCPKVNGHYRIYFTPFAERIDLPRKDRQGAIAVHAARFADLMERRMLDAPFQWFNFYDYWGTGRSK